MTDRRIYLVTHTQARHHVERRVGGGYDSKLTDLGHRQAERIAAVLASRIHGSRRLWSSDLTRAVQTSDPISRHLKTPASIDAGFREVGCGVAEGKSVSWLQARLIPPPPGQDRLDHQICEGAETRRQAATRIYPAMERATHSCEDDIVIVTHGFALTFVICHWIGMPIEAMTHVQFGADSGGITVLDEESGNHRIVSFNATAHLELP